VANEERQFDWDPEQGLPEESDSTEDWEVDDALLAQLASDARLTSGLPEGQSYDEEAFIQQSGLTRPPVELAGPESAEEAPAPESLDPEGPLSFYEVGVQDVDGGEDPHDEVLGKRPESPATERKADPAKPEEAQERASVLGEMAEQVEESESESPEAEPEPEVASPESNPEFGQSLSAVLGDMARAGEDAREADEAEERAAEAQARDTVPMGDEAPEDESEELAAVLGDMAERGEDESDQQPPENDPDDEFVALPEHDPEYDASLEAALGEMAQHDDESLDAAPPTPVPEDDAGDEETPEPEEAAGAFDSLLQDLSAEREEPNPEPKPAADPEPVRRSIDEARDLLQRR